MKFCPALSTSEHTATNHLRRSGWTLTPMRFVNRKEVDTPEVLRSPRALSARMAIERVLTLPEPERSRQRAPIEDRLFLNQQVAEALRLLFRSKCAYCERHVGNDGSVEHFRPLSNASHGRHGNLHHYSWLAYDWRNLLWSCHECARRKANSFPVRRNRAPLLCTIEEARSLEEPELLDPTFDEPEKHLAFFLDGSCSGRTRRGHIVIDVLELNRPDLVAKRADRLGQLGALLAGTSDHSPDSRAAAPRLRSAWEGALTELLADEAPHSGAVRIWPGCTPYLSPTLSLRPGLDRSRSWKTSSTCSGAHLWNNDARHFTHSVMHRGAPRQRSIEAVRRRQVATLGPRRAQVGHKDIATRGSHA